MIPAIDSYSWHRAFGQHYPGLEEPSPAMTLEAMIGVATRLGARGLAVESCFFPQADTAWAARAGDLLAEADLAPVWAWGHPRGLNSGRDSHALDDLIRHLDIARALGADVMRICAGGRATRPSSWEDHRTMLLPMLREAAGAAEQAGVTLALENHIDLLTPEIVELMEEVASPALGICLDTANQLRLFEDPLDAARAMAPWVRTTHVKDIVAWKGDPKTFAFWPSVPAGTGLVPLAEILALLDAQGYRGLLALEIDYLKPGSASDETDALAQGLAWLATQPWLSGSATG